MRTPSPQITAFLRSQHAVRIIPVSHETCQPLLELLER